ncbi:hypothetical protein [Ramlibacter humi]|uniref:DUF4148 domain-containing protein n=1 Tax=Ramlibacter humi TaxID=2530451 RepID=A0A4Z0BDY6_9BURK|nr:hypothetical protein [Ramlibacter humi]TFY97020.1 hypothetical protein EZ216_19340 [Ramlibacter humi]
MKYPQTLPVLIALAFAGAAHAQAPAQPAQEQVIQRQVNQQQRVENGLKDGSLTVREAGRIEKKEAGLDRMIARDSKDGISAQEQKQINARENAISRDIARDAHNAKRGDPAGTSNQRMQADVQRNVNQDQRIQAGVQSGQLSGNEVSSLERGQARVDRTEARAARNGHVSAAEQAAVQRRENKQSRRIHRDRQNG